MAVRLKDIARELGLSVVTVSKVLRDHPDISAETKTRVLQRMKELDYRPNLAARALVTGKTYIIGLVVPDLVQPFFALVASGLSRSLRKNGYNLVICSSEESPEFEQNEIDQLLSRICGRDERIRQTKCTRSPHRGFVITEHPDLLK